MNRSWLWIYLLFPIGPILALSLWWTYIYAYGLVTHGWHGATEILLMMFLGTTGLVSFLAVLALGYLVFLLALRRSAGSPGARVSIRLVFLGMFISVIGVTDYLTYLIAGKPYMLDSGLFFTYALGSLLWVPMAHILYLIRADKNVRATHKT